MNKKKKKQGKHFLKRYKRKLRSNIVKDVLLISQRDVDTLKLGEIPAIMFQPSSSSCDSIINNGEWDALRFSAGYASVAINLLNICKYSINSFVKDSYIFPALYCFRIYMENSMKESILLFKHNVKKDDLNNHSLESLWEKLTPFLHADEVTRKARRLIFEYGEYDPDSTAFRYSHLVNQQLGEGKGKILSSGISIDALGSSMLFIYQFLEGVNDDARMSNDIIE